MTAHIFVTGDDRYLVARFDSALNGDVLSAVPGGLWDKRRNAWRWRKSERTARDLVGELQRYDEVECNEAVSALVNNANNRDAAVVHKHAEDDDVPPIELPLLGAPPWWVHQRRAFHFARELTAAGIYIGMGGGKSRVVVDLVRDRGDERVLILCPKNVVGVWPKQFDLYAGEGAFRVVAPRKKSWTVAKRAKEIEAALAMKVRVPSPDPRSLIVVVNYDAAWREPMKKLLLSVQWDRVVLDESHRVKSAGGKAARFVQTLGTRAKRRMCLTGTPMPHTPLDVYGQYRFLDPGIFGTNFTKFRARYAEMGGMPVEQWNPETREMEMMGTKVVAWHNEEELAERTYSIAYRIADEELDAILGLEPGIHEQREAELLPSTMRLYRELYDEFCAEVGSGVVTFDNALVKLLRLAQVTSGHLPVTMSDGERLVTTVEVFDMAKAEALKDLLEDIPPGEPVVVFARFTHDLDEIARVAGELKRTHAELSGRRRDGLADDATLAEGFDVVGVQMRSGGEGVDFSRSHYCVFYSVGYSLGDYEQALKRTHRPGQTRRVAYYHLVVPGTVDAQVYVALQERRDVVEYVLGLAS
jgi:SNF2 family DNA or RNA helicase